MAKQLARKSTLNFFSALSVGLFGFISLIFVKRYLGYEAIGMLAFAAAYVKIYSVVADLGFGIAHSKHVNDDKLDEAKCNGTLIFAKLAFNFLACSLVLISIFIAKYHLNYEFESKTLELILYLSVLKFFIDNLINIIKNIYAAKLQVSKIQIPKILGRAIQTVGKVSIAVLGMGAAYIIGIEIIISFSVLLLMLVLFRGHTIKKPDKKHLKIYTSFALPVIFLGFVTELVQNLDKLMLHFFVGSEEVGIYTVPFRFSMIFLLMCDSIMRLLFPSFAELSNKGKFDEIAKISNKSVKYVSIVFVPIIIFFVGFSEPFLVFVFGADSYKSTKVMQILVLAVYVEAIRRPYNVQVLSSGNLRYAMLIATVIMLSNSILNLIMIPQKIFGINTLGLGAEGASLATLLSFTFGFILSKYYSYRITGTKIYIRIWIHIFAGIVSLLLIYYFSIMGITPILIPVYYLISLIMYFTILFLLNEFRRKELNFFLNAINPKKMKDYIQSEIKN